MGGLAGPGSYDAIAQRSDYEEQRMFDGASMGLRGWARRDTNAIDAGNVTVAVMGHTSSARSPHAATRATSTSRSS